MNAELNTVSSAAHKQPVDSLACGIPGCESIFKNSSNLSKHWTVTHKMTYLYECPAGHCCKRFMHFADFQKHIRHCSQVSNAYRYSSVMKQRTMPGCPLVSEAALLRAQQYNLSINRRREMISESPLPPLAVEQTVEITPLPNNPPIFPSIQNLSVETALLASPKQAMAEYPFKHHSSAGSSFADSPGGQKQWAENN